MSFRKSLQFHPYRRHSSTPTHFWSPAAIEQDQLRHAQPAPMAPALRLCESAEIESNRLIKLPGGYLAFLR
jgi:hypothetical protein